jgi:hypothetical protein
MFTGGLNYLGSSQLPVVPSIKWVITSPPFVFEKKRKYF